MSTRRGCLLFTLVGIILLSTFSLFPQQTDPFYLSILEKAQKSFLAREYQEAARDFEIAAFGLMGNRALQAKAKIYLSLCRYYLNDLQASERSLREAADLMGEQGFASLEIYESAWPDLDKLISFFNLTQDQKKAPPEEVAKPSPADPEAQRANPGEPAANKPEEKSAKPQPKETEPPAIADPPAGLNVAELKEGDMVPLDLVDTRPSLKKSIPAAYPEHARPLGIEGTVLINALISEKGDVIETELIRGIKNAVGFDQAALRAVRLWKFEPASVKGIKVRVWLRVAVEFKRTLPLPE